MENERLFNPGKALRWGWLNGLLPSRVYPTRIDGLLERRGRVILYKQIDLFSQLSRGQERALRSAARGGLLVVVCAGDPNVSATLRVTVFDAAGKREWPLADRSKLRQIIADAWLDAGRY